MVTCGQYQNCFDESTLAGLNNCLNGGTHGPVHIKIGGEWNNPEEELATQLGEQASRVAWQWPGRIGLRDCGTVSSWADRGYSVFFSGFPRTHFVRHARR